MIKKLLMMIGVVVLATPLHAEPPKGKIDKVARAINNGIVAGAIEVGAEASSATNDAGGQDQRAIAALQGRTDASGYLMVNVAAGAAGGASGTIGAAVPATVAPIGVKDNVGNLAYPKLDASGNLLVAVTGAGSGGTSSADGAVYTAGTTAGTPAMGAFDDVATTACAENAVCIARLTAQRGVHVNFRNASGTEIGTASNPIQVSLANTGANATAVKVDGSAVTQPVSIAGNQAVNVAQVAGTATDTNSGLKSAGTQRVVLATDQPQLTNALKVDGSAVTQPVSGTVTVTQATASNLKVDLSGTAANATAIKVDGSAVTQPVSAATLPLPTGASTAAKQPALGTAGAASADVITIQGIAAMTPVKVDGSGVTQPVSGTVTVQQATASNLKAQVNQLAAVTTSATLQNAAVANGNGTNLSVDGMSSAVLTVNCATCSGGTTVNFELTEDGSNWVAVKAIKADTFAMAASTTTSGVTVWQVPIAAGFQSLRARISAYSAGTVTVTGHSAPMSAAAIPQMAVDSSGNLVTVSTDATDNTAAVTTGPQIFGVASSATPSAVGADGRSKSLWLGTHGEVNVQFPVTPQTQPVPGTSGGTSPCYVSSAATTNATNCKASAGQLYGVEVINTTSTIYYLRLYNLSSSPTCSSSTGFVRTIPIPHNSGGGAGVANFYTVGEAYGTGIGFCLTGGGSSTDNTNAATGVYITLHYK